MTKRKPYIDKASQRPTARSRELRRNRVIRFWNNDVLENTDGVVQMIERILLDSPSPGPSRKREGR